MPKPKENYGVLDTENYSILNSNGDVDLNTHQTWFDALGGIWNDITGASSQTREFQQQEYLQDKMNEYNLPANQMARMKAAGINPNLAAGGISQGGNESAQAPQVSTNTGGVQGAVGALSGLADAITGGISNVAAAGKSDAEKNRIASLLPLEVQQMSADYNLTLENIGLTAAQAAAVQILNRYQSQQLEADIAIKTLQLPLMQEQMNLYNAQYYTERAQADYLKQQAEESKSRVDLMTYEQMNQAAQAAYNTAQANWVNQKFKLLRDYGWDTSGGFGALAAGLAFKNADGMDVAQMFHHILMSTDRFNTALNRYVSQQSLEAKIAELEKNADLQKDLMKYGVKGDFMRMILRDVVKYLFGTGQSVSTPIGTFSNAAGE